MNKHLHTLKKAKKGAALVEYVVLLGLIGVTLIAVLIEFGFQVDRTFDTTNTVITERLDPAEPDPDTPATPDVPVIPDIPDFPDPPPTPSGTVYQAGQFVDAFYEATLTLSYAEIATLAFQYEADISGPGAPAAQFDFYNDVTWTGLSYSFGVQNYNELEFGTTGLTHNIGPLPGWGPSPASSNNCNNTGSLDGLSYTLVGYHTSGDEVRVGINFYPRCPFTLQPDEIINMQAQLYIRHNQALAFRTYGATANAVAQNLFDTGQYDSSIIAYDYTDITNWTVTNVDLPSEPNYGLWFRDPMTNTSGFSFNASSPGPAYSICGEGPFSAVIDVTGTHPERTEPVNLQIVVTSETSNDECFMPFGP